MTNDAYEMCRALASGHALMKKHADYLRALAGVRHVTHWSDRYNLEEGFRWEEFVDAELLNGQAISWHWEVTLTPENSAIESDIRLIHEEGQDTLVTIADHVYPTVTECYTQFPGFIESLCSTNPGC